MLADHIDHVIGVDTHKDSHSAAVVNPTGSVVANRTVPADAFGYKCIHRFALEHAPGRRLWAIEGTGSFGSGLTTYLLEQGEWVTEIDRPARPARRNGPRAMRWMRPARPGRRWAASIWPSPDAAVTARPFGSCWPPATAPCRAAPERSATSRRSSSTPPRRSAPAPQARHRPAAGPLRPSAHWPQPVGRASRDHHRLALYRPARAQPGGRGQ